MKARKLLAAAAALALVAGACGGDDDTAEPPADATDDGGGDTGGDDTGGDDTGGDDTGGDDTGGEDTGGEDTGGDTGGDSTAGQGGNLLMLQWQAPSQANAYLSTGTKDLLASSIVLEPLMRIASDGSFVPTLVTEIPSLENGGLTDDQLSVTYQLLDGVTWSDGSPFTAADVVFSYEYCSDELTGCSADFTGIDSVVADDDLTVTINFTEATPYPFTPFVGYTYPVIQRAQFESCIGEGASACSDQNFAPIGTGPYMVTDLRPEDTVTYAMNPNYRGVAEGKPFFGTVEIKGGGDAEAAARSVLEIGEADYAWNLQVAPEILGPMEGAGNGRVVTSFTSNVEHINLNQTDPDKDPPSEWTPTGENAHPVLANNPEFARALSLAINRDELVAVGYGPTGVPTCNIWPVGQAASTNNDECLTQDLEEANRILDDLGYLDTDGDGVRETDTGIPLEFGFVTSTNAVRQSNQELIQSYWAEIGVVANMRNEDASLFFDGTSASDASIWKFFEDMEMFTNGATTPDAAGYMVAYKTEEIPTAALGWPASNNMPRYSNPDYDATWDELSRTPLNDPARDELVIALNDMIVQSGAIIPLIYRGNVSGISSAIDGFGDPNGWDSEYWNIEEWTRTG